MVEFDLLGRAFAGLVDACGGNEELTMGAASVATAAINAVITGITTACIKASLARLCGEIRMYGFNPDLPEGEGYYSPPGRHSVLSIGILEAPVHTRRVATMLSRNH